MLKNDEPLVAIVNSKKLLVEPIWENPIDDIEGPLYREYILENPEYNQIFVRETVSKMLERAVENLPKEYRLVVRAGHRPLKVQYQLLDGVKNQYLSKNPAVSEEQALEFARTYVSDPSIKLPPHCCGAAIDVDVLSVKSGKLVDFGCPVNTDSEVAYLKTDKISKEQMNNRKILQKAMLESGFAPFDHEWWHFSYGDKAWADYHTKSDILYGLVELK